VCGLPISTYFSGVKLRWLLDKIPAVRKAADEGRAKFGTIDTWLLHSLAGDVPCYPFRCATKIAPYSLTRPRPVSSFTVLKLCAVALTLFDRRSRHGSNERCTHDANGSQDMPLVRGYLQGFWHPHQHVARDQKLSRGAFHNSFSSPQTTHLEAHFKGCTFPF